MAEDNGPDIVMKPNFDTVNEHSELRPLCDLMDSVIKEALELPCPHNREPGDWKEEEIRLRIKARDIVRVAYATGNLKQWIDLEEDTSYLVENGRKDLELMKKEAGIDH